VGSDKGVVVAKWPKAILRTGSVVKIRGKGGKRTSTFECDKESRVKFCHLLRAPFRLSQRKSFRRGERRGTGVRLVK